MNRAGVSPSPRLETQGGTLGHGSLEKSLVYTWGMCSGPDRGDGDAKV